MPAPIELYYWPTPNGWKITIALHEMGLPYEIRLVNIGRGDQFRPEFLKVAPNNRMPAIVDPEGPDGAPISVFESGAILQYLARKTGRFYGAGERQRVEVEEWLFWQVAGLGPMAGQAHHFLRYAPSMEPPNDLPYPKRPLPERGRPALRRARQAARGAGIRRRRLLDRRHGDLALGEPLGAAGAGHRRFPAHGGLARPGLGAPGGAGGPRDRQGEPARPRRPTARRSASSSGERTRAGTRVGSRRASMS